MFARPFTGVRRKIRASRRLVIREYLPMAGSILLWAAVAAACGVTDAALLLTAWALVSAVRSLVAVNLQLPVALSLRQGWRIAPSAWRRVWLYEAATALFALGLIALLASALASVAGQHIGALLLVVAIGLPARHIGPLVAYVGSRGRETGIAAPARSLGGALLAGIAAFFQADPLVFAAILAMREWFGLIALIISLLTTKSSAATLDQPVRHAFEWGLIARASGRHGRKRIAYRMLKTVLSGLLGPVGTALARTMRGTNLLAAIERRPAYAANIAASVAVATTLAIFGVLSHGVTPAHLVAVSALFRLACIGANAWFWSVVGGFDALPDDDDEDDD